MLELLAISREDGWAYVRTDHGIRLIRPPYAQWSTTPVSEEGIQRAVLNHGFSAIQKQFAQWKDVIDFLNDEIVAARAALGQQIPESGLGEEMLALAPDDILIDFLDRIEHELLPNAEWRHAENILMAMLKLDHIRQNSEMGERVVGLLARTQQGHETAQNAKRILVANTEALATQFPRAFSAYGGDRIAKCSDDIAERRQIFAFPR